MKPNTLQLIMMQSYAGGQFAGMKRDEDLRQCPDKVFVALYHTLDDSVILDAKRRGMDPALLAAQRINGVMSDIGHVAGTIGALVKDVPVEQRRGIVGV